MEMKRARPVHLEPRSSQIDPRSSRRASSGELALADHTPSSVSSLFSKQSSGTTTPSIADAVSVVISRPQRRRVRCPERSLRAPAPRSDCFSAHDPRDPHRPGDDASGRPISSASHQSPRTGGLNTPARDRSRTLRTSDLLNWCLDSPRQADPRDTGSRQVDAGTDPAGPHPRNLP